jgi:hypothetical protein
MGYMGAIISTRLANMLGYCSAEKAKSQEKGDGQRLQKKSS